MIEFDFAAFTEIEVFLGLIIRPTIINIAVDVLDPVLRSLAAFIIVPLLYIVQFALDALNFAVGTTRRSLAVCRCLRSRHIAPPCLTIHFSLFHPYTHEYNIVVYARVSQTYKTQPMNELT